MKLKDFVPTKPRKHYLLDSLSSSRKIKDINFYYRNKILYDMFKCCIEEEYKNE